MPEKTHAPCIFPFCLQHLFYLGTMQPLPPSELSFSDHCLDQVAGSKKPYVIHRDWNSLRGWFRADVSLSTQVSHIRKLTSLNMWQHDLQHQCCFFSLLSLHSLVDKTSKSCLCVGVTWSVTKLRFLHYHSHRKETSKT